MSWELQYTPQIWPMLASAMFCWALAAYVWRHRASPGATAFAVGCSLVGLWTIGRIVELSVTDQELAYWWFRFQMLLSTPCAVSGLCFVLQYAGLRRWINRTTRVLLIAPSVIMAPAYLLNDARILWGHVEYVDGRFVRVLAPLGMAWNLYGLAVLALSVAILVLLFVRSPLYRKAAALMMLGHSAIVGVQILEMRYPAPMLRPSLMILAIDFNFAMYAIAFFRHRALAVVPVARDSVVERMPDAMIVVDASRRIADLNLAAQNLIGLPRTDALGRDAAQVLGAVPELAALMDRASPAESQISLCDGSARRWYRVNVSTLEDGRGFQLGNLVVLHDTTELRSAQQRLLQKEHATAALQEREVVARELHDAIGQVLGYVSVQVEATRKLLQDGKTGTADTQLARLASVAQDAHADVRGYILELRAAPSEQHPIASALGHYLDGFGQNYGLRTELDAPKGLDDLALGPEAQRQLFRIVQEALTNARRHGGAKTVQVSIDVSDSVVRIVVQDDGSGFDPDRLAHAQGGGFGLQFMRERAQSLGGQVRIESAPSSGARVVVEIPLGWARESGGEHEGLAG